MRHWLILACIGFTALGCAQRTAHHALGTGANMPNVIIFHHALGVTPGVKSFADELREAGYRVEVPDLFEGRVFDSIEAGVANAQEIGFDIIIERGVAAAEGVTKPVVVIGFSLGVLPAQKLAQTTPGVRAAVLCHSAVPVATFGEAWPASVALQLHMVEADPWAEEDLDAARELAAAAPGELYLYPGTGHLVADSSYAEFDADVAQQMTQRIMAFLHGLK